MEKLDFIDEMIGYFKLKHSQLLSRMGLIQQERSIFTNLAYIIPFLFFTCLTIINGLIIIIFKLEFLLKMFIPSLIFCVFLILFVFSGLILFSNSIQIKKLDKLDEEVLELESIISRLFFIKTNVKKELIIKYKPELTAMYLSSDKYLNNVISIIDEIISKSD